MSACCEILWKDFASGQVRKCSGTEGRSRRQGEADHGSRGNGRGGWQNPAQLGKRPEGSKQGSCERRILSNSPDDVRGADPEEAEALESATGFLEFGTYDADHSNHFGWSHVSSRLCTIYGVNVTECHFCYLTDNRKRTLWLQNRCQFSV
jgi:hypothetical protein